MSFTKKLIKLWKENISAIKETCVECVDTVKNLKQKRLLSKESLLAPLEKIGAPTYALFPSIAYINICQLTGVFNDNLLKLLLIFFLIDLGGTESTPQILATIGVVYVIPFLFLSSLAGKFADCMSKKQITVLIKACEVLILLFGCFCFLIKTALGGYCALFLLASKSALYGPAKYGILKDLFPSNKIATASSSVTSFTYIGIILGMFFASFLTSFTGRNFTLSLGVGVIVSLFGFIAACLIPRTVPRASSQEIGIKESFQLWRQAGKIPFLQISLLFGSFFLFIGAFVQLNIIPFAMEQMGLSDVYGGYLFLGCAIGIALGALATGQFFKKRPETAISSIAGILLSLGICALAFSGGGGFWLIFLELLLIGFLGGCFVVPCETHLQLYSPDSERGAYIALLNFLSFTGVLLAAVAIALFGQLGFMAKGSFILLAVIIITVMFFLLKKQLWSLLRLDENLIQKKIEHKRDPSTWPIQIDPLPSEVLGLIDWRQRVAKGPLKTLRTIVGGSLEEYPREDISSENALLWVYLPQIPSYETLTPRRILTALSSLFEGNPPIFCIGNAQFGLVDALCKRSKKSKKSMIKWWNKEHLAIVISEESDKKEERLLGDILDQFYPPEKEIPEPNLKLFRGLREKLGSSTPFYYLHWEIEVPVESEETALKYPKKRWKGKWIKVKSFL